MRSFASPFSAAGRIAVKPFAVGVSLVYFVSFASQLLLAAPVVARAGVVPFAIVQAAAMGAWYALHVGRLRDAGRASGMTLAITVLYGLGTVLLLLIILLAYAASPTSAPAAAGADEAGTGVADFVLLIYLVALFSADPNLGIFGYVMLGALALIVAPTLIALAFSVWAATRISTPT